MSVPQIDLSVIIVSWNTSDYLKRCIHSILENTRHISFEIIVVDNHSRDGTQGMIREIFPDILLIENKENLGLARANNQGISQSKGRHILILNSDTYVTENALEAMVRFLDRNEDAGAVNPRTWLDDTCSLEYGVCPLFTPAFSAAMSTPLGRFTPSIRRNWAASLKLWLDQKDLQVEALIGACFMVRRSLLDRYGLLDENLFIYFEDIELSLRLIKKGYKLYIVSDANIVHYLHKSGSKNEKISQYYFESMRYFYKNYFGSFSWASMMLKFAIYRWMHRILRPLLEKRMKPHQTIPLEKPVITWPPDPDAERYLFEVSKDPNFIGVAGIVLDRPSCSLEGIDPSGIQNLVYYWRARSIISGRVRKKYLYGSFSYRH